jgi:hypothetical protein
LKRGSAQERSPGGGGKNKKKKEERRGAAGPSVHGPTWPHGPCSPHDRDRAARSRRLPLAMHARWAAERNSGQPGAEEKEGRGGLGSPAGGGARRRPRGGAGWLGGVSFLHSNSSRGFFSAATPANLGGERGWVRACRGGSGAGKVKREGRGSTVCCTTLLPTQ